MERFKLVCRLLWEEFRSFVTSRWDVTAFLLCLLLTCCMWFFHAMYQKRSPEIRVTLIYTGVPENVTLQGLPGHLQLEVSDEGRNFYANRENNAIDTVQIDLSNYIGSASSGNIRIDKEDVEALLKDSLPPTANILYIRPAVINGYYLRQSSRLVPVLLQGDVLAADQYILSLHPTLSPQRVRVYGPRTMLDTITCIYTQRYERRGLRDTLRVSLRLQAPSGCQVRPNRVQLNAIASQFTEKRFRLPVEVINAPAGSQVKALPSEVEVICNVSMENYKQVTEKDIHVIMDYSLHDESGKILLTPRYSPDLISNVRINPMQVDYVVE